MIRTNCLCCKSILILPDYMAGTEMNCPRCREPLLVPSEAVEKNGWAESARTLQSLYAGNLETTLAAK